MSRRPPIPKHIELAVLKASARRCALCFGINRDFGVKRGQIAHINHRRDDHRLENLAFLCLDHHDEYDSSTCLSKNITHTELRTYRNELRGYVSQRNAETFRELSNTDYGKSFPYLICSKKGNADLFVPSRGGNNNESLSEIFEHFGPLGEEFKVKPGVYCKFIDLAFGKHSGDDHVMLVVLEHDLGEGQLKNNYCTFVAKRGAKTVVRQDGTNFSLNSWQFYCCLDRRSAHHSKLQYAEWFERYTTRIRYVSHCLNTIHSYSSQLKVAHGIGVRLGIIAPFSSLESSGLTDTVPPTL